MSPFESFDIPVVKILKMTYSILLINRADAKAEKVAPAMSVAKADKDAKADKEASVTEAKADKGYSLSYGGKASLF